MVLRSAVERLQSLVLAEETAPLNRSASGDLNAILRQLNQMQVLLKGKTQHKDRERQIEELDYQIEDVIESYRVLGRSSKTWGLNGIKMIWWRKAGLSFTLRKIRSEITSIIEQIEFNTGIVEDSSSDLHQNNNNNSNLIGLEEDHKQVLQFLLSDDESSSSSSSSRIGVPVIPICGVVGSGKSTLAKLVYEDPNIVSKFQTRKWIKVPHKFEIGYILGQIIGHGYEWVSYSSEEQLPERVKKILNSQRSLIVLDDIRSTESWDTVCRILAELDKGSWVLVTTRVGYVAKYISQNQFVHTMTPLNEGDSWDLFTKVFSHPDPSANLAASESPSEGDRSSRARFTFFTDGATTSETDTGFEVYTTNLPSAMETDNRATSSRDMLTKMVRSCDGSPKLIKDLALYLGSKETEEWEMVHKNVRACLFEFCCPVYNELPDHLQPCFVYLGHFLEDQEIDPEKLSHLWMIEGLLSTGESARGERMMDMTERYLRELALEGMVEVQAEEVLTTTKKLKACRIVQGMERFCVSNCEQNRFLKIIDLREEDCSLSSSAGLRRLVIYLGKHNVDISPKVAKNIRSLRVVLRNKKQIIDELVWPTNEQQIIENELVWPTVMLNLKEFRVLRILDFDGIDFRRQKLPMGIFNLELLRYLSFRRCVLEELPSSISKLSYLQVLDLRVEGLAEIKIPNVLQKMRWLNHLYLPLKFGTQNSEKLRLDSLTELETLVNFNTTLCRTNDVLRLCKLRHLAAKVEENFDDFESITNYMKTTSNNQLHSSIDIINLDCYAEERHSVLLEFLRCKVLRTLNFEGYIGRLPPYDEISQNFTQLVLNKSYLKEDPMPALEKLPSLGILILSDDAYIGKEMVCSASGFTQLKRLELVNLSSLKRLEMENTAMPILSTLKVKCCANLGTLPNCLNFRAGIHIQELV